MRNVPFFGERDRGSASWHRRALAALAVLVLAVGLAACGGDDDDGGGGGDSGEGGLPSEFALGVNVAESGAIAPFDGPALDGLEMAVDEINAEGGIGGQSKIVLSVKNNRSDAAESAKVTQQLADEGVDFIILPGDASIAIPGGTIAQEAGVPMMTMLASTVTQRDAVGDLFFSAGQADNLSGAAAAKYAREAGIKTAYTLTSPDASWLDAYPQYFAQTFEKLGGTVVGTDTFRVGTQDFSAQISKIQDLDEPPDVIMTTMYEPEFPAFVHQLRATGVETPLLASDAVDTPAVLELGDLVVGMTAVTNGFPTPGSPLKKFYTKYQQKTGEEPPGVLPAVGYDTAYIIADAVERAGSTDAEAIRRALEETDYKGVLGETTFGIIPGFPVRPASVQEWAMKGGELGTEFVTTVNVEPNEIPDPLTD